jgi:dTDP-glucose 4,6-dehydratase
MSRLTNKKIFLVTGGLGFIGSHFIEKCLKLGHKVINIDKITYASNSNINFEGDYDFIKKDIADLKEIPNCDFIINFAAESHVDNSISESINFLNSNIKGVYNIFEIIKNNKIKSALNAQSYKTPIFFQISTDEVFGDIEKGFFKEEDRHHASNPYSATKSAAEQIVFAWSRTYNIPFLMTRTTNNYGCRQHPEKLIPCAITKLLKNKKVPIHGDGSYIRNWIHVEDNVDAIFKVIDKGEINNVYHIASEEELSVTEIVSLICKKLNIDFNKNTDFSTDRSGADLRYALNYEKIKSLGWSCKKNINNSLDDIIDFYRKENICDSSL